VLCQSEHLRQLETAPQRGPCPTPPFEAQFPASIPAEQLWRCEGTRAPQERHRLQKSILMWPNVAASILTCTASCHWRITATFRRERCRKNGEVSHSCPNTDTVRRAQLSCPVRCLALPLPQARSNRVTSKMSVGWLSARAAGFVFKVSLHDAERRRSATPVRVVPVAEQTHGCHLAHGKVGPAASRICDVGPRTVLACTIPSSYAGACPHKPSRGR
jgi:hypothetical protein